MGKFRFNCATRGGNFRQFRRHAEQTRRPTAASAGEGQGEQMSEKWRAAPPFQNQGSLGRLHYLP
jgi:hypothetical protein